MPLFGRNKNNDKDNNDLAEGKPAEKPAEPKKPELVLPHAPEPAEPRSPESAPREPHEPRDGEPAGGTYEPADVNMQMPLFPGHAPAPKNEQKPSPRVPDNFDFDRYFLPERRIVLENVSYETQRPAIASGQLRLNVKDTIVAQLLGHTGVKITYNRMLRFEPDGPFTLSVSFSVLLIFNPATLAEVEWKNLDMAELFKRKCPGLTQAMITKTALLIAEITNANGTPILPVSPR